MRVALALLLAACQQAHVVTIQLGPTQDTLSAGFNCVQDDNPMRPLVGRALQPDGTLQFSLVVDLVSLGGQLPGCRGEELIAACPEGTCSIVPRDDGSRYCRDVTVAADAVDAAMRGDFEPMLDAIRTELQMEPVTLDAPDEPVLIRAVATAEASCASVVRDAFDETLLLGCAYSCPVQLDEVDGPIALSLDTLNRQCEKAVIACARFPR
jgi:hypothetical protein